MKPARDMLVGGFFFGMLALLGVYTIVIGNLAVVTGQRDIEVTFPQVGGLNIGQDVRVAGVDVGTVTDLELTPEGQVDATLTVAKNVTIFEHDRIKIVPLSVLGGSYVAIERQRPPGEELDLDEVELTGEPPFDIMGSIGEMMEEGGRFDEVLTNIRDVTDKLNDPEAGLLGMLTSDSGLVLKVDETVDQIRRMASYLAEVARQVRSGDGPGGPGTVHRLIYEDDLYENLNETLANMRSVSERIERGEGAAGALLNDPQVAEDLRGTLSSMRSIVRQVETRDGPVGVMIRDEEAGRDLARTVDHVEALTRSVREGRGTIGRLWTDPALFDEARRTLVELRESTEDLREQAPINAFMGAALSAF